MRQTLLGPMAEMVAKDELLERQAQEVAFKQALEDNLTHELTELKQLNFTDTSEKFCAGPSAQQKSLLEETLDADIAEAAGGIELASRGNHAKRNKQTPKAQSASRSRRRRTCRVGTCTTSPRARPAAAR